MPLDPDDSRPPYLQIIEDITSKIEGGTYAPGAKLPSRQALVDEYAVAPMTIQHALMILKERGLVVGRQGQGVFVRTNRSVD